MAVLKPPLDAKLDLSLLETFYWAYDAPTTSVVAQTTIDALLMFGFELAVIAVVRSSR